MKTINPYNTPRGWLTSLGVIVLAFALFISALITVTTLSGSAVMGAIVANVVLVVVGMIWLRSKANRSDSPIQVRSWAELKQPYFWAMVGAGLVLSWLAGQSLAAWLYSYVGSANFESHVQSQNTAPVVLLLLVTLVLAPAGEEVLMRGVAYTQLRKHLPPVVAAVLTAGIFSLMHLNVVQIAVALPLGLLLAAVYEHTGRLLPVIVLHSIFNLAAALVSVSFVAALASLWFVLLSGTVLAVILWWLYTSAGANAPSVDKSVRRKS